MNINLLNLRRSIVMCTLMLCASIASLGLTPSKFLADDQDAINLEAAIPKIVGDWTVDPTVVPISVAPGQQEVLDQIYSQIVSRTYVNKSGQRIMFSVAYGSSQTRQMRAHRQEVCYAAQGFQINNLKHETISIAGAEIAATRMVAVHMSRTEPVTYWFTMGDSVVRSYVDRQLTQLRYALSGVIPDGYLFRVSSISQNPGTAFEEQAAFSELMIRAMQPALAEKLIGSSLAR